MPKTTATEEQKTSSTGKSTGSILLAEDSPIYGQLISTHLKEWGFHCVCVKDGKEAWKLLMKKDTPRLTILDWVLPEIDGIDLCRRVRGRPEGYPYTYTILLTAKNRQQEMLEAMEAGADDFLAKPFDPLELKARLLVGQRIVELQQKLVSANNALQFVASHDFLTGAWNRAEIVAFMRRELARAHRDATPLGIILVDVDHFKKVNDEFGHETGDIVLKEITKRLSTSLRDYDGIGRYGGEEFLLIIPGCDLPTTTRRANQIREVIASSPITISRGQLKVTVSMGATIAESSANPEFLLRHADAALYEAKHNGRNRVETRIAQVSEADTQADGPTPLGPE
jgi:two-component system cell cycle response regulator